MQNNTNVDSIRIAYESILPPLQRKLLGCDWGNRAFYIQWLAHTHAYVTHTTRLVALSAAHAYGPYAHLHTPLLLHAGEENAHDRLLVDDLQELDAAGTQPNAAGLTAAFAESLYYQISYETPYALFGRVIPLEGAAASVGAELYDKVCKAHGEKAATFAKAHAENDPLHIQQAFAILTGIPQRDAAIVCRGIHQTAEIYTAILDSCANSESSGKSAA